MKKNRNFIQSGYQWHGRIWLDGVEGTFLGYGRVMLLERIKAYGSISQAAKSMEMSFKHAKDLIDSMNRQAGCKLVTAVRGGRSGGGATLTPMGEKAIMIYWHYHERFQVMLQEMSERMKDVIREDGVNVS